MLLCESDDWYSWKGKVVQLIFKSRCAASRQAAIKNTEVIGVCVHAVQQEHLGESWTDTLIFIWATVPDGGRGCVCCTAVEVHNKVSAWIFVPTFICLRQSINVILINCSVVECAVTNASWNMLWYSVLWRNMKWLDKLGYLEIINLPFWFWDK